MRQFKIAKKAQKFIKALPADQRKRVKKAVAQLIEGDMETLDISKLEAHPNEFRLRVGKVRILFSAGEDMLFIFKAGFRGDVYK